MEITYFERVAYREPAVFWVFKERIDNILASFDNIRSIDDMKIFPKPYWHWEKLTKHC